MREKTRQGALNSSQIGENGLMCTSADMLQHQGVFVRMGLRDSRAGLDKKREKEGRKAYKGSAGCSVPWSPRLPGVLLLALPREQGLPRWEHPHTAGAVPCPQPRSREAHASLSKDPDTAASDPCCQLGRFGEQTPKTCPTQSQILPVTQGRGWLPISQICCMDFAGFSVKPQSEAAIVLILCIFQSINLTW